MAAAAWVLPAISLGLAGTSAIIRGVGERRGAEHEARQADRAFRVGQVQAAQTDSALRGELDLTLRNIRAIMAARGQDPSTPSAMAFLRGEAEASDRDRRIAVSSLRLQAGQSALDAIALRRAGRFALFGGIASGLGEFARIGGLRPNG